MTNRGPFQPLPFCDSVKPCWTRYTPEGTVTVGKAKLEQEHLQVTVAVDKSTPQQVYS